MHTEYIDFQVTLKILQGSPKLQDKWRTSQFTRPLPRGLCSSQNFLYSLFFLLFCCSSNTIQIQLKYNLKYKFLNFLYSLFFSAELLFLKYTIFSPSPVCLHSLLPLPRKLSFSSVFRPISIRSFKRRQFIRPLFSHDGLAGFTAPLCNLGVVRSG